MNSAGPSAPSIGIELRSDSFTLPTPKMLAPPLVAALGDDRYGEDPTVRALEDLAADMLGKETACLMPTGTMANLTALLSHCPRGGKAIVGDESDIYVYESGGAAFCGGVVYEPLPNESDGSIDIAAIADACAVDPDDPRFAPPAVICLEAPHNRCGGVPLPLGYLAEAHQLAEWFRVPVHLDGARLFNAAAALGVPAAELAKHADTVTVCLTKGLCAPVGALLAGDYATITRARRFRTMLGGGMRQAGVIAAAGIVALTEMTGRLVEDHVNASRLARGVAGVPGLRLLQEPVTNMVFFNVEDERYTTDSFIKETARRGILIGEFGHDRLRAVTHAGVGRIAVDAAVETFAELLATAPVGSSR
jgi:threonine aldolase